MASATDGLDFVRVTVSSTVPTTIYAGGRPKYGIQLKALAANTGIIYVGKSTVSSSLCYPLAAGETLFLPIDNTDVLRALASVNNDKLHAVVI